MTTDTPASDVLSGDAPLPPKAAAPTGQDTPSPEATAAQAKIETLKGDKDFIERYTSGNVEARHLMAELHECAFPEPEADTTPPPATPAEAAKAHINELRNDPDFVARVEQGDILARAELDALASRANPVPLPFTFDESIPVSTVVEANQQAHEVAEALGVDSGLASGAVKMLDRAHAARLDDSGAPRPMDQLELAKLDYDLQAHFGSDYDTKMDAAELALKRAGDGGAWLRQAILAAGPTAALWAFQTLANLPGEPR